MMVLFNKKNSLVFLILVGFLVGLPGIAGAQTQQQQPEPAEDVTEEDLERFSDTYSEIQNIQKGLNTQIGKLIENSSFKQEEFNSLYQSQAKGNKEPVSKLNDSKKKEFNNLKNKIMELQNSQQEKMMKIIKDKGLTVKRFNGILTAVQQDSELYKEFQEIHTN